MSNMNLDKMLELAEAAIPHEGRAADALWKFDGAFDAETCADLIDRLRLVEVERDEAVALNKRMEAQVVECGRRIDHQRDVIVTQNCTTDSVLRDECNKLQVIIRKQRARAEAVEADLVKHRAIVAVLPRCRQLLVERPRRDTPAGDGVCGAFTRVSCVPLGCRHCCPGGRR